MNDREIWLVGMVKAGHQRALDELVERYWPLLYNVVGHGLSGGVELERVLRHTIGQIERELPELPEARLVRAWATGTALRQVRQVRRPGRATAGGRSGAGVEPDFAAVAVEQLGLAGQARELVEATRWLSPYDRDVLPLWWLTQAGELSGDEMIVALDLPADEVAARVRRMRERLDTSREVVAALAADPPCPDLAAIAGTSAHRPAPYRRDQLARHIRECGRCAGHRITLLPAAELLATVGLVPPPDLAAFRAAGAPDRADSRPAGSGRAALGTARDSALGAIRDSALGAARAAPSTVTPAASPELSPAARSELSYSASPGAVTKPPAAAAIATSGALGTHRGPAAGTAPAGLNWPGTTDDFPARPDGTAAAFWRRFRPGSFPLGQRLLLGLVGSVLGAVVIIALLPTQRTAPPPAGRPLPPPPPVAEPTEPSGPAAVANALSPVPSAPSRSAGSPTTARRSKSADTPVQPATPSDPQPFRVSYEAETARRYGDAEVMVLSAASGGRVVRRLGTERSGYRRSRPRSGAIEFTAVTVPKSGRYELTIFYVSGERRDAYLRVNEGSVQRLSFSAVGGWDTVLSARFPVQLEEGANSVQLGNPWDPMPSLDRITVTD